MSLRLKLTAILLSIGLIPVLFSSLLIFRGYRESLRSARIAELGSLADWKTDQLESYFSDLKNNLAIVQGAYVLKSNLPVLSAFIRDPADPRFLEARRQLDERFGNLSKIPGLADIVLFDLSGTVVYPVGPGRDRPEPFLPPAAIGPNASGDGVAGIFFSDLYPDPGRGGSPAMFLAAPVSGLDQKLAGFIVCAIDPAALYAILRETAGLGESGEILIGRREGDRIVFLNPLKYDSQASLRRQITIGDPAGVPLQEAAQGESGAGLGRDYRGTEVVAAWRYIPSLKWGLVAKVDAEEAFAEVAKLRNATVLVGGIVLLLGGLIAFSVARSISRPIAQLSRGAAIIGSGNLDHRVTLPRNDEIGQLSRTLDAMTGALKRITAARDDLNREIAERARLERALKTTLREHEAILDSVPAMIFFKDRENRFLRTNRAFEDAMAMPKSALEGRSLFEIYPREQAEAFWRDDLEVISSGVRKTGIVETMTTSRGARLVQTDKIPYIDARGEIVGVIGFSLDITERQQAQGALRRASERLELAHQGAGIGAWDWDVATGRLEWTPELFDLFGIDPASAPASFEVWRSILHPEDLARAENRIQAALRAGGKLVNEYRVVRPDGAIRWIYALGRTICDETGRPARMIGICMDISDRKQAEEELRRTRDYLESLFNYANAPIICWDTKLRITRFNPAFEKLTGHSANSVIGRDLSLLFPPASRQESLEKIRRTLNERWEVVEIPILRRDGEVRIALWNSANVYADDGRTVLATIAQGQDITERQKSQQALQTLNRTLRALSNCSQALIRAGDEATYLQTVCRIIVEDCGYAMAWIGFAEHDAGKTVRPVASAGNDAGYLETVRISWEDTDRGQGPTGRAVRLGKIAFCQNMLTDPSFETWRQEATRRGYAASIALPLVAQDAILGVLNIYSRSTNPFLDEEVKLLTELSADIAEGIATIRLRAARAQAEAILQRDKDTLEKLVERRSRELLASQEELAKARRLSDIGALAATVAHELRNPLAAIAFAAANIKRKAANPSLDVNIRTINKKVAESDQIIDNLLFYSRLRPPRLENVSLARLIQECVQAARVRFKKGVSLKSDLAALHEVSLEADPLQLKEVFGNILSNADEAIESGEGSVEIRGRAATDSVSITFADTGSGMESETLEQAFSPFFTTKVKGTGLGLAICQNIVQMHGGSIAIESAPGRGTTVTVHLPRKAGG